MTKRTLFALLLVLTALALAIAGCGGDDDGDDEGAGDTAAETAAGDGEVEGDAQAGESVFASAGCGGCHTLEEAGATGTTAPNLDETSLDYDGIREQVENGGGGMPAFGDQLTDEEIANVSAFVFESSRD